METARVSKAARRLPSETPVLVVGGGPAGLITSLQLAKHGIRNVLVERNHETTKWPKMDITNCRSMELLGRLGLAGKIREKGVPPEYSLDCLFSTGLSEGGELIAKWDLPSPNVCQSKIQERNDGSMPRYPYQRCSQEIFEAWLKEVIEAEPLIDSYWGVKFESLRELEDVVESELTDMTTGALHVIRSQYVAGCDGAGSRVRKSIGIELTGGPMPMAMFLVHFKSRDLESLHKQGRFWHIFFSNGGIIISQDEKDTWTTHLPIPLGTDVGNIDPTEAVYEVLGGSAMKHKIKIDKILVQSSWRPNLCVADQYRSEKGKVFLVGDSAHQNIPFGGYGMNTGLGDAFDIGWKLATFLHGYGGSSLLDSYEAERRPVALRNVDMSGVHTQVHLKYIDWVKTQGHTLAISDTPEGQELRRRIRAHVLTNDGENQDLGIEMDYRYNRSPIVLTDKAADSGLEKEPEWNVRNYTPSTWPGARAPHVFLADGKTSIYDLFGSEYTLIDFTMNGEFAKEFTSVASHVNVPLDVVHLPNERNVRDIWERDVVLVRPDDHVAWRVGQGVVSPAELAVADILLTCTGKKASSSWLAENRGSKPHNSIPIKRFTGTIGDMKQDPGRIELLAVFQQ
ncbi:uncharacterized protein Z519_07538 [Cladophialophora bantiana CBS 173.52]|uniref:FAD-binding domain-containing protein n=1 Tax=Cladophialophora bantiana (strain ATCC 10958 / CBS 173.52 / CDC B-1940 / NIH 8579) TaxID=1442370 RepID=A0A0D2ENK5_CLAB1|nr:uncharacterized protein Z519_07538 [Cladophialophora bantiana CBS 173.52]KIW91571.1 hypothetical protein Z519_07538 [Cladophialophora bantiana CBS 173.52]